MTVNPAPKEVVSHPAVNLNKSASAFVRDKETAALLKEMLPKWGYSLFQVRRGSVSDAIRKFSQQPMPTVLIVDISSSKLPLTELEELAEICPPSVNVVVLGDQDNVGLYRDMMEIGVTDYLVKPVPSDLLYKAVGRASGQITPKSADQRMGKTVSVYGVRGGVGATTTVANLGWILSMKFKRHVILNDLNIQNGSLALEFGLEPTSGLAELLQNPARIDQVFIDRATLTIGDHLKALVSEQEPASGFNPDPEAVETLTQHLRNRYHFVLQDMARAPGQQSMQILGQADIRILVMDNSLPSLRDCARLVQILDGSEDARKLMVILNRTRPSTSVDIAIPKIENFIGHKLDAVIPFDKRKLASSSLLGEPVAAQKGRVTDAFDLLASKLIGKRQEKARPGWFSLKVGR
jgi:pilus assembly protein CpaE